MTDREKFEVWKRGYQAFVLARFREGEGYVVDDSQWAVWQASRKQAIEEAALICGNAAAGLALEIEAKGKPQTMPDVLAASVAGVAVAQASKLGSAIRALANPEGEQE